MPNGALCDVIGTTFLDENRSYNLVSRIFFPGCLAVPTAPRPEQIKSFIIWSASVGACSSFRRNFRSTLEERTTRISYLKYEHRGWDRRIQRVSLN